MPRRNNELINLNVDTIQNVSVASRPYIEQIGRQRSLSADDRDDEEVHEFSAWKRVNR